MILSPTRVCRLQLLLAVVALFVVAPGSFTTLAQSGVVPIVIPSPAPRAFDLVLNELWLRRPDQRAREIPQQPNPNLRHIATRGAHAVFAVDNALTPLQLVESMRQLEGANPQSEAYLVLYERGAVHNDAHRVLLTREVAVVVRPEFSAADVLASLDATPLSAVPGAFIVRADDPLASIALAEKLRNTPGVQTSYPLLKRLGFPR